MALRPLRPRAGDVVEWLLPPHPATTGARSSAATLPISANLLTGAKASDLRGGLSVKLVRVFREALSTLPVPWPTHRPRSASDC